MHFYGRAEEGGFAQLSLACAQNSPGRRTGREADTEDPPCHTIHGRATAAMLDMLSNGRKFENTITKRESPLRLPNRSWRKIFDMTKRLPKRNYITNYVPNKIEHKPVLLDHDGVGNSTIHFRVARDRLLALRPHLLSHHAVRPRVRLPQRPRVLRQT